MTDLSAVKRQEDRITAAQFFILLFTVTSDSVEIARIGYTQQLTYTQVLVYGLPSLLGTLLLLWPVCALCNRFPDKNILEVAQRLLGRKAACVLAVLLSAGFVIVGTVSLSMFLLFMRNTLSPQTSVWLLAGGIVGVSLYGACKGLETVARTALWTGLLLMGAVVLFVAGALPFFSARHREPLLPDALAEQFPHGFSVLWGRSFPLTLLPLLQDQIREKPGKAAVCWTVGEHLFLTLLLFLLLTCLGPYAYTQLFPLYTLSAMAGLPPIERLDALYLAVWLLMLVLRLGTYLFAVGKCVGFLAGQRKKVPFVAKIVCAALCGSVAALGTGSVLYQRFLLMCSPEEWLLPVFCGAVPSVLLAAAHKKQKKRGNTV